MFATLEKINAQGTTVIVVEQHIHHVLRICQRGYVLERGRVVHEGSSAVLQADDRLRTSYLGI
jgi:branched-chain amino acid transport system ATP-binding protein